MISNIISGFLARVVVALCNLGVLLVSTRNLGSEIVGQVSLLVLNIAVIQTVNEIFTGPAIVYFIPKFNLKKIYRIGISWTVCCVTLCAGAFTFFNAVPEGLRVDLFMLTMLCSLYSFHNVIFLGRERVRLYSLLVLMQPALMFTVLAFQIFVLNNISLSAVISSLYSSWIISFIFSSAQIFFLFRHDRETNPDFKLKAVLKNGLINQAGNLAHTLSNRLNYYVLSAAAVVGVYATSTSLIESTWIIGASISPVILTRIANQKDGTGNNGITFLLAKISFLLSLLCVVVIFALPESFYTSLLGKDFSGTRKIMLLLSPGVLCISFSTIISHYFSGLGKQKVLLFANLAGLSVTATTCYYFITRYGVHGACFSASLSYLVQALVLTVLFMRKNKLPMRSVFYFSRDIRDLRK